MPEKMNFLKVLNTEDGETLLNGGTVKGRSMGYNDVLLIPEGGEIEGGVTYTDGVEKVTVESWDEVVGKDLSGAKIYFDTTKRYDDHGVASTILIYTDTGYSLYIGGPPNFELRSGADIDAGNPGQTVVQRFITYNEDTGEDSWESVTESDGSYTLPSDFGTVLPIIADTTSGYFKEDILRALKTLIPSVELRKTTIKLGDGLKYSLPSLSTDILTKEDLSKLDFASLNSNVFTGSQKITGSGSVLAVTAENRDAYPLKTVISESSINIITNYSTNNYWETILGSKGYLAHSNLEGSEPTRYFIPDSNWCGEYDTDEMLSTREWTQENFATLQGDNYIIGNSFIITDDGPNITTITNNSIELDGRSPLCQKLLIKNQGIFEFTDEVDEGGAVDTQVYKLPPVIEEKSDSARTLATREWIQENNYANCDESNTFTGNNTFSTGSFSYQKNGGYITLDGPDTGMGPDMYINLGGGSGLTEYHADRIKASTSNGLATLHFPGVKSTEGLTGTIAIKEETIDLASTQTITGAKTFTTNLKVDSGGQKVDLDGNGLYHYNNNENIDTPAQMVYFSSESAGSSTNGPSSQLYFPNEDGTLATQEWVVNNITSGGEITLDSYATKELVNAKEVVNVTLTEEQAGATELKIALQDVDAFLNARRVFMDIRVPVSESKAANTVWFSVNLVDYDIVVYNQCLHSGYNAAWDAGYTVDIAANIFISNFKNNDGRRLYHSFVQPATPWMVASANSRTTATTIIGMILDIMKNPNYAPYLKITSNASLAFPAGTQIIMEAY